MKLFSSTKALARFNWVVVIALFLVFYVYFFVFNKFHLLYLEQVQLFRFSADYFNEFVSSPGQFIFYLGNFLVQFFISPAIGALLITLLAACVFFLSRSIFKKLNINNIIICFIPVLFIAALQSSHLYRPGLTIGLIFTLLFANGYLLVADRKKRIYIGVAAFLVLYHLSGGFALLASLLAVIFELLYFKTKGKWINSLVITVIAISLPYLAWRFVYLIPLRDAWFFPFPLWGVSRLPLFAVLLAYFPIIIAACLAYRLVFKKEKLFVGSDIMLVIIGSAIVVAGAVLIKLKAYDPKNEMFLGVDYYVQNEHWDKAIKLTKAYPGSNRLVICFGNLALFKTGQLADRMFDFKQIGPAGLYLDWSGDEITTFFGGEVYWHLNHINESYRWAFESMVAKGMTPRVLKRLALTSLINGHYPLATKYLGILEQSMFYDTWAKKYLAFVADPSLIEQDKVLIEKRRLLPKNDFVCKGLGISELLRDNPKNKMAFEYLMSAFILNKDIESFAANINRIKELGYREIPVNYEEALLFCMAYFKKNLVPEGFTIRPETLRRRDAYIEQIAACRGDLRLAAQKLRGQFGNSCWYYFHFIE